MPPQTNVWKYKSCYIYEATAGQGITNHKTRVLLSSNTIAVARPNISNLLDVLVFNSKKNILDSPCWLVLANNILLKPLNIGCGVKLRIGRIPSDPKREKRYY